MSDPYRPPSAACDRGKPAKRPFLPSCAEVAILVFIVLELTWLLYPAYMAALYKG